MGKPLCYGVVFYLIIFSEGMLGDSEKGVTFYGPGIVLGMYSSLFPLCGFLSDTFGPFGTIPDPDDYIPGYYVSYRVYSKEGNRLFYRDMTGNKPVAKRLVPSRLLKKHPEFLSYHTTNHHFSDLYLYLYRQTRGKSRALHKASKALNGHCSVFLSRFWDENSSLYYQCGRAVFAWLYMNNKVDDQVKGFSRDYMLRLNSKRKVIKLPEFIIDKNNNLHILSWKAFSVSGNQKRFIEDMELLPVIMDRRLTYEQEQSEPVENHSRSFSTQMQVYRPAIESCLILNCYQEQEDQSPAL